MHLPLEFYQGQFKTLVTVLLKRLHDGKSPKLRRDFVVSSSVFIHKNSANVFSQVLNEVQQGLLVNLITGVWGPVLQMTLRLDERKVCIMAIAKLVGIDEVRQNPQLLNTLGA